MMNIAVIIPVHNRRNITIRCINQIELCLKNYFYTIIVIDDGSTDGTSEAIKKLKNKTIIIYGNGNLWWTGAVELGRIFSIKNKFTHILIINDDLYFEPQFFDHLVKASATYPEGVIGSVKINESDKKTIVSYGYFVKGVCKRFVDPYAGTDIKNINKQIENVDAISGSTILMPVKSAKRIGPFDSKKFPHNFGDLEYTYRATTLGIKCYTVPKSRVYTIPNKKYLKYYLFEASRIQFLKNLFDRYEYGYGFFTTFRRAYINKGKTIGTYCLLRSYFSLFIKIIYKIIIWNTAIDVWNKKDKLLSK